MYDLFKKNLSNKLYDFHILMGQVMDKGVVKIISATENKTHAQFEFEGSKFQFYLEKDELRFDMLKSFLANAGDYEEICRFLVEQRIEVFECKYFIGSDSYQINVKDFSEREDYLDLKALAMYHDVIINLCWIIISKITDFSKELAA